MALGVGHQVVGINRHWAPVCTDGHHKPEGDGAMVVAAGTGMHQASSTIGHYCTVETGHHSVLGTTGHWVSIVGTSGQ